MAIPRFLLSLSSLILNSLNFTKIRTLIKELLMIYARYSPFSSFSSVFFKSHR